MDKSTGTLWKVVVGAAGVALAYLLASRRRKSVRKTLSCSRSNKSPNFRLLALDLDGTTLNEAGQVVDETVAIIREINDLGIHVALCTGRMTCCALPVAERLGIDVYFVVYNGGMVLDKGSRNRMQISYKSLPLNVSQLVLDYCVENNYAVNFYHGDTVYSVCKNDTHRDLTNGYKELTNCKYEFIDNYDHLRDVEPPKLVLLVPAEHLDEVYLRLEQLVKPFNAVGEGVHLVKAHFFVEFLRGDAHKGDGIERLCEHLDVGLHEVVGFGDGNNDAEYLNCVGLGIAMKNGSELCKSKASRVSEWTNDENGVAKELSQLLDRGCFA